MSGHRRVKDIAYDDDDLGDYDEDYDEEEQEELSPEDQRQMREGTVKVREALGTAFSVSDKDIQEALWNYYYDVGKSVSYLKNKIKPQQPKKAAQQPSRFDQAANNAAQQTKTTNAVFPFPPIESSPANYFRGIPWPTQIEDDPQEKQHRVMYSRGGLLGGSSKPSKLAALAAARRKTKEEKGDVPSASTPATQPEQVQQSKSSALLDRLSTKNRSGTPSNENNSPGLVPSPLQTGAQGKRDNGRPRVFPIRRKQSSTPTSPSSPEGSGIPSPALPTPKEEPEELLRIRKQNLLGSPSAFAKTLLGNNSTSAPEERSMPSFHSFLDSSLASSDAFSKPSPDDVVLRAQAKGTGAGAKQAKPASKQANDGKPASKVVEGLASMTVEDAPKVKSKNLNVAQEFEKSNLKNAASFVVIGHVDHGKSTLMGRLLYDLKFVDQRSMEKLRKEAQASGKSSFALAWVMDATSEERSRGVTVDVATNSFSTSQTNFTILDAPGHRDFVPNMIAGASQADFAVLVIDASTNSFESGLRGQTKEHALLARSLGISRLLIAVNKMDTTSWSQERFEEISQQMRAFLTTAGFASKNLTFIPCAGLTGENIVDPIPQDAASWYSGPTLLAALDSFASEPSKRALEKPARLTISEIFSDASLRVSGRLDAGTLQVGDVLLAQPSGERASIRSIEVDSDSADWCVAGQLPTLILTGIDPVHLRLGDILCSPNTPVPNIKSFTAKILTFEHVMPGYVDVHKGRLNAEGKISKLVASLDKATGAVAKKKPRVLQPGSAARVVIEMERALPLEAGNRMVLRNEGNTVASGLIESVE